MHSTCTNYVLYAYLYCGYVLISRAISIGDPFIRVVHESVTIRVLFRNIFLEGKLGLRAVLAAPGGGCGRGMCPLLHKARKLSPF